jgi:hypothetical protein
VLQPGKLFFNNNQTRRNDVLCLTPAIGVHRIVMLCSDENGPPEHGDRIQFPKRRALNRSQDDG